MIACGSSPAINGANPERSETPRKCGAGAGEAIKAVRRERHPLWCAPPAALLDGTSFLAGYTFEMNSASFGPSIAFSTPAGATMISARVHIAFGNFVPPFLLTCRPDFLAAASLALEILVDVISTFHKIWDAVAVVWSQIFSINSNALTHFGGNLSRFGFCCTRFPLGL